MTERLPPELRKQLAMVGLLPSNGKVSIPKPKKPRRRAKLNKMRREIRKLEGLLER